jgi:hypothetical protein
MRRYWLASSSIQAMIHTHIPNMFMLSTQPACIFGLFSMKLLIPTLLESCFRLELNPTYDTLWSCMLCKPTYTLMEQGGALWQTLATCIHSLACGFEFWFIHLSTKTVKFLPLNYELPRSTYRILMINFRHFPKIWQSDLLASSCQSVHPSVRLSSRMEQLGSHWTDSDEILYSRLFEPVEKIQVSLKSDKNNGHFRWRRFHVYDNNSLNCSQNEKCFK